MQIDGQILKQQINTLLVLYYPHLSKFDDPFLVIGESYNEAIKMIAQQLLIQGDHLKGEFEMTRQAAINLSKCGNVFGIDNLEDREYV